MDTTQQEVRKKTHYGITFGSQLDLSDAQLTALVKLISKPIKAVQKQGLGGRAVVLHCELEGIGRVVIKQYRRGGIFRALLRNKYLRWGATRSEQEWEQLNRARSLGVNVPTPIAFAHTKGPFYKAWLVTKEINETKSIEQLVRSDEVLARSLLADVLAQIEKLILSDLFHIDLHPGNVMVDSSGKIYLLDFDKAYTFKGKKNTLRDMYLHRWRRAVLKHELPEFLTEVISLGLRKNFEKESLGIQNVS